VPEIWIAVDTASPVNCVFSAVGSRLDAATERGWWTVDWGWFLVAGRFLERHSWMDRGELWTGGSLLALLVGGAVALFC
jgi:hypothetical protein